MNCARCGLEIKRRAKYCPRCAYPLSVAQKTRRCYNCGVRVAEAAVTCFNCGVSLQQVPRKIALPTIPLSLPTGPLLGAFVALIMGGIALAATRPWQVIQVAVYYTPTPTFTFTPAPSPTPTFTPTSTPTLTPTPEPPYILHRVRLGENLTEIANRYRVSVEAIMALNGLSSPNEIQYGLDLKIPVAGGEETSPTPTPTKSPTQVTTTPTGGTVTYVVKPGDNLSEIAAIYGVTVGVLMQANGITQPENLQAGQTLIIPVGTPTPIPTATPLPLPSPTPTPEFVYAAPVLLSPAEGQIYLGAAASLPVLLNWVSVGLLAEEEWYLVSIYYSNDPEALPILTQLTKLTSFRTPLELRPAADAPSHLFRWEVSVVREVPQPIPQVTPQASPTPEFNVSGLLPEIVPVPEVDLISPQSEMRSFFWY